jgi:hypothetical protein
MQRIIIISFLLLHYAARAQEQGNLADSLLVYEYAYFIQKNDTVRQEILLEKINFYLRKKVIGKEVFNEIKRLKVNILKNDFEKKWFLWNAAIVAYLNTETEYSRNFVSEYGLLVNDTSVAYHLLIILANKYSDTLLVNKIIKKLALKDSDFNSLSCFADVTNYNRKHLNFYLFSSAILPGAGTVMNGAVVKGFISLALTSTSIYGVYQLVEYGLYANAFLWGTGVGLKFYSGNIKLTEKVFEQGEMKQKNKLANSCELKLNEILLKYPITLKVL